MGMMVMMVVASVVVVVVVVVGSHGGGRGSLRLGNVKLKTIRVQMKC